MRFAIYARKSTESEDRQIQSLDDQIRELSTLARREGFTVIEVFQESKSAKAPGNRPEFDRMVAAVEAGEVEAVLTWSINRLSRNPVDGGRIAYLLQTGRLLKIRTIEKTYLPDDNALLLSIENGMATAYVQDLSRNVKRGMKGKFERGWLPAKAPLGYRNDSDSKEIVVDPHRFPLVRRAWDMLLTGDYSIAQLGDMLREDGLTYFRRGKTPRPVARNTVYRLFRDRFYSGVVTFKGETRVGKHRAMVTEFEFEKAQEILAQRHRNTRMRKYEFVFQGAFVCEACGCAIIGETKFKAYRSTRRNAEYTYYHCTGRRGCSKEGARQEQLAKLMTTVASKLVVSREYEQWLQRSLPKAIEIQEAQAAVQESPDRSGVEIERARLDALVTLRADGEIGAEEFRRAREQILERITASETAQRTKSNRSLKQYEDGKRAIGVLSASRQAIQSQRLEELSVLAKQLGPCRITPSAPGLEIAPVLRKIVAFEPLVLSDQSHELSDDLTSNPKWLTFWDETLNLLSDASMQQM